MRFYKTTGVVRVPAVVLLALTLDQIRRREHLLSTADDRMSLRELLQSDAAQGLVLTREPNEFKRGEIIGFAEEPRALLPMLEPLEYDDDGDGEMFGEGTVGGEANSGSVGAYLSAQQLPAKADAKDEACTDGIEKLQGVVYAKLDLPGETEKTDLPVDAENADESAEAAKTDLPVDAEKADEAAKSAKKPK